MAETGVVAWTGRQESPRPQSDLVTRPHPGATDQRNDRQGAKGKLSHIERSSIIDGGNATGRCERTDFTKSRKRTFTVTDGGCRFAQFSFPQQKRSNSIHETRSTI
jgi:hypothetical protein